ncbi:hypothetical protein CNMCM5793_000211 [Aspergillus hiratsukae]|uniref:Uncharacterized protein n=1 Tax=Aspergillus hiratsukae TaxID=1194566 RepID=A0A8H6PAL3_9EURO|nr:hypothetical protein CNMCM5793_000211 [Aspergillus hiratsukae]
MSVPLVPIETVQKFAPSVNFHPNERYFPCGIEYMLQGGNLHQRTFRSARKIAGQNTSTPALACLNNYLVMVYKDADANSSQLWGSRSTNGIDWIDTQQIPGDANSSQLWVTSSADGLSWAPAKHIQGQATSVPAIATYNNTLFMVYRDTDNFQLWMSQATQKPDGSLYWFNTKHIDGQKTDIPALAVFKNKLVMVYTGEHSSQLWVSQYDGTNWTTAQIDGQHTSVPALAVLGDWIIMTYKDSNSTQFWATHSKDGYHWTDAIQITGQAGYIPALAVMKDMALMKDVLWMVYSDSHSSQLWNELRKTAPDYGWWLEVNPTQFSGQKIGDAVMYYAVQKKGDQVKINYIILYAYQGGQTLEVSTGLPTAFTGFVVDTGAHVGDLERFAVYLRDNHDGTYTFDSAEFEAHGDTKSYTQSQMDWEGSTHPIVCVALNGHGIWNQKVSGNPIRKYTLSGVVSIGDWLGDISSDARQSGLWWRPWSQSSGVFKRIAG